MRRQEDVTNPAAPGARLLGVYAGLARRGRHLLADVLAGASPAQWDHYPPDDAVDRRGFYQWFYHSHAPEDRPGADAEDLHEHGHLHLFARRPLWGRRLRARDEQAFHALCGHPTATPDTRHLLAFGFDAQGLPTRLFTVNSWVTDDLMLGHRLTAELLADMTLDTGYPDVDAVLEAVVHLCPAEIDSLLEARDQALARHPDPGPGKLADEGLEVLSSCALDLDAKLAA